MWVRPRLGAVVSAALVSVLTGCEGAAAVEDQDAAIDDAASSDASPDASLDPDAGVGPLDGGNCSADDRARVAERIDGLARALPDVTGDGLDDFLLATDAGIDLMAGPLPGTLVRRLRTSFSFFLTVATGDLDHDGARDLVVSTPWTSEVAVLFGPVDDADPVDFSDAPLHVANPTDGLSNRFGLGVHVADVTGDDEDDLVVGASAEGEEGCFGTDDTVVYAGPLAPDRMTEADATLRIPAAEGPCLGFPIVTAVPLGGAARDGLLLGTATGAVWLDLPLGADPAIVGRESGGVVGVTDLDRDGLTDIVGAGSIRYGDGRVVGLELGEGLSAEVLAPVRWRTGEDDVIVALTAGTDWSFRRLVDGVTDLESLPEIATAGPTSRHHWTSTGDLDGDGFTDLVVGDALVRCE